MKTLYTGWKRTIAIVLLAFGTPLTASAHCDSLDGPVIEQARQAIAQGDVTPTLKWVPAEREAEIRSAFAHTAEVRKLGGKAAELADRYFFETLVRVHREGEGAPYTGLRPVGQLDPVYVAADQALKEGSVDELAGKIAHRLKDAIETKFATAVEKRGEAEKKVEYGREYVAAYVEYMHLVESLHKTLAHVDAH